MKLQACRSGFVLDLDGPEQFLLHVGERGLVGRPYQVDEVA